MCYRIFVLNACAGTLLLLAFHVLTSVLYGQLPNCDGTYPGKNVWCGTGTNCPSDAQGNACTSSQCVVIEGYFPNECKPDGDPDTQLCQITPSICSYTYWCWINPSFGTCDCSNTHVVGPDGNYVFSTAPKAVIVQCMKKRT